MLALFAGVALRSAPAAASPSPRIATLDWAVAATLIALGAPPVGVAEPAGYRRTAVEPAMPEVATDLGLRTDPNPEVLHNLAPDLIVINPAQSYLTPALGRFADVAVVPLFAPKVDPYTQAEAATRQIGQLCGRAAAADQLVEQADKELAAIRSVLGRADAHSLCIFSLLDDAHVTVFGSTSLFAGVLNRLKLKNAWTGATGPWGAAPIGIEHLASLTDARFVRFGPVPPAARALSEPGSLWQDLQPVRAGRVTILPSLWAYGGLPAALRIARLLQTSLPREPA